MVKRRRCISKLFIVIVIMIMSVCTAFAHSGRTDSSGGHRDNNNKSGLGSYHYHCGGYPAHLHSNGYCPYTDTLPSGVDLKINKNTLAIGEEATIYASVYPSNACNTNVKLESSDSNVVMVYGNSIKAVGYGTATITARSFNDKISSIKVTVKEIQAQSVSLTSESYLTTPIYVGDTIKLSAIIYPDNIDNKSITWKSSDESIATISC